MSQLSHRLLQAATTHLPAEVQAVAVRPGTHQLGALALALGTMAYAFASSRPELVAQALQGDFRPLLGLVGMVATVAFFVLGHLKRHDASVITSVRHLYLMGLTVSGTLILALAMQGMALDAHATPLVAAGMLWAIFVNPRVALLLTFATGATLAALAQPFSIPASLAAWAATFVGIEAAGRVQQRFDLAKAGLWAGAMGAWVTTMTAWWLGQSWVAWSPHLWAALGSGVGGAILVVGLLPYLEGLTGITTTFKLLELANPSQPLLRELQLKAPGTYHHSILVGNLAEAAAEAIGADALLVRVGSYYHDIGKTKRPYFFIENQLGMANQHDRISPRLSALVITAHVKEGLDMAREAKLPAAIQDFIATHHGTSLVSYFYHQAVQAEGARQVVEEHFRYPGPRPRTKETGIVMLADGVEASCRSLKNPTPDQIEQMVRKIVDKRLGDGELSEAPLTLKEIEVASAAFVRVLSGLFHHRIEYPDQIFRELRGGPVTEIKSKRLGRLP